MASVDSRSNPPEAAETSGPSLAAQQHYVTFYSPGTIVSEQTAKPVEAWNVDEAVAMARGIKERHGALPYGFAFSTRGRKADELDSREVARSPFYWLGGRIETLEEVEARNDPKESILRGNMRGNGYDRIVINDNSWRFIAPFKAGDVMLDVDLRGAS